MSNPPNQGESSKGITTEQLESQADALPYAQSNATIGVMEPFLQYSYWPMHQPGWTQTHQAGSYTVSYNQALVSGIQASSQRGYPWHTQQTPYLFPAQHAHYDTMMRVIQPPLASPYRPLNQPQPRQVQLQPWPQALSHTLLPLGQRRPGRIVPVSTWSRTQIPASGQDVQVQQRNPWQTLDQRAPNPLFQVSSTIRVHHNAITRVVDPPRVPQHSYGPIHQPMQPSPSGTRLRAQAVPFRPSSGPQGFSILGALHTPSDPPPGLSVSLPSFLRGQPQTITQQAQGKQGETYRNIDPGPVTSLYSDPVGRHAVTPTIYTSTQFLELLEGERELAEREEERLNSTTPIKLYFWLGPPPSIHPTLIPTLNTGNYWTFTATGETFISDIFKAYCRDHHILDPGDTFYFESLKFGSYGRERGYRYYYLTRRVMTTKQLRDTRWFHNKEHWFGEGDWWFVAQGWQTAMVTATRS